MAVRVLFAGAYRSADAVEALLEQRPRAARTYKRDKDGRFGSGGGGVRDSLAKATTTDAVGEVLASELHGIGGRAVSVNFTGADVQIAREYSEGILRGQERYPDAHLGRVALSEHVEFGEAGHDGNNPDSGAIYFGAKVSASREAMDAGLAELRSAGLATENAGPTWIGLHEMAHVVNNYSTRGPDWPHYDFAARASTDVVRRQMASDGVADTGHQSRQDYIGSTMSAKAAQTGNELVSEAVADSLLSGPGAAPLSHSITAALDADYAANHTRPRSSARTALNLAAQSLWPPCDQVPVSGRPANSRTYHRDKDGQFSSGGGGGMSGEEFDSRLAGALHGSDVSARTEIDPDDPAVREALRDYNGGGSYAANGELRTLGGDKAQIENWYARRVADGMDRAFEGRALDHDAVVTRGINNPSATFGGQEVAVGMEWVDHGFVSTSASSHASAMFTGEQDDIRGGVAMRILAPAGTPAISSRTMLPYDSEVVLGRGLRFRVVADHGEDYSGVRQLDVEVVGSAP